MPSKGNKFRGTEKFRPTGEICLHICAEFNEGKMFAWFIQEYGADINAVNQAGETPLIIAAREGKLDIIRLIIENFRDIYGFNID